MVDQVKDESRKPAMTLREDLKNPTLKDALDDNLGMTAGAMVSHQKAEEAIAPSAYPYGQDDKAFMESAVRGAKVFLGVSGCICFYQHYGRESNLVSDYLCTQRD